MPALIVGFTVTVAIWPSEVVFCRDFILRAVATFWAMSLVRIYPSRPSSVNGCYFSRQKKKTIVGTTTAKEKAEKETDRQ